MPLGQPEKALGHEPQIDPWSATVATDDVRRYVRERQNAGAADASINRELATLKRMFKLGLQCTPPKVLRAPFIAMLEENNVRQGFVEDVDFARLTAEASELWLRVLLELAFTYGWRRGELVGLRVRQVNLALGTIRLDPGSTRNREGREVAMTAKVRELLTAAIHAKRADDFVLTRADGSPSKSFGVHGTICASERVLRASSFTTCGGRRRRQHGGLGCLKVW